MSAGPGSNPGDREGQAGAGTPTPGEASRSGLGDALRSVNGDALGVWTVERIAARPPDDVGAAGEVADLVRSAAASSKSRPIVCCCCDDCWDACGWCSAAQGND